MYVCITEDDKTSFIEESKCNFKAFREMLYQIIRKCSMEFKITNPHHLPLETLSYLNNGENMTINWKCPLF